MLEIQPYLRSNCNYTNSMLLAHTHKKKTDMQTNGIEDSYSYSHLIFYKYIHFYFAKKYTLVGNQLYLSHFAVAVVRQPDHRNIRKEGLIQLTAQAYSPSFWGNDSSRSLGQLVPLHAQRPVSQVAMDLIRFTIEINHHDPFQQTVLAKLDISVQTVEYRSPPLVLQKTTQNGLMTLI